MKKIYTKKFSPNITYNEMREFEIDILGDPEKVHENDDIDIKYYSEDNCKVTKIIITKMILN